MQQIYIVPLPYSGIIAPALSITGMGVHQVASPATIYANRTTIYINTAFTHIAVGTKSLSFDD